MLVGPEVDLPNEVVSALRDERLVIFAGEGISSGARGWLAASIPTALILALAGRELRRYICDISPRLSEADGRISSRKCGWSASPRGKL